MTAPEGNSLWIDRLEMDYFLPREHPAPESVRAALDSSLQPRVAKACGEMLGRSLDAADPSVWIIREIDLALTLDLSLAASPAAAELVAANIASGIARTIARGADGDSVLYFPDRAAYLARFLSDLVSGVAWDQWFYGEFDALRPLPTGAAAREALARHPHLAGLTLQRMASAGRLEGLLAVATAADALRLARLCVSGAAHTPPPGCRTAVEAIANLWPDLPLRVSAGPLATPHNALRLYLDIRARLPALAPEPLLQAVGHMLAFADMLRGSEDPAALIDAIAEGRFTGIPGGSPRATPAWLHAIERDSPGMLAKAAQALSPRRRPRAARSQERFTTPHGGMFLLLPALASHEWRELTGPMRCLLLMKCLGEPDLLAASQDPCVQLASGLEEPLDPDALAALDETAAATAFAPVLARLAADDALRGNLSLELAACPLYASPVAVVRDAECDYWVGAGFGRAALARSLQSVELATGAPPRSLLLGPAEPASLPSERLRRDYSEHLRQAAPAAPQLLHLAAPALPPGADLAWSVLAQALLRGLARRLLGFAWASAGFLHRNLLASSATVAIDRSRVEALIEPPPLEVVLHLAGRHRQAVAPPWLPGIEISICVGNL